jgi:tryptophanyl-tRNA synthetase
MSLQDASRKMSKSDVSKLSCINLIDDSEMIRAKIRKAKTDSLGAITYEPNERPEVANLLRIYSSLTGMDPKQSP